MAAAPAFGRPLAVRSGGGGARRPVAGPAPRAGPGRARPPRGSRACDGGRARARRANVGADVALAAAVPAAGARDRRPAGYDARRPPLREALAAAPARRRRADRARRAARRATRLPRRAARRAARRGRRRRRHKPHGVLVDALVELGRYGAGRPRRCRRWSTPSRTSTPTRACRTCASCTATSTGRQALRLAISAGGDGRRERRVRAGAARRPRAAARPAGAARRAYRAALRRSPATRTPHGVARAAAAGRRGGDGSAARAARRACSRPLPRLALAELELGDRAARAPHGSSARSPGARARRGVDVNAELRGSSPTTATRAGGGPRPHGLAAAPSVALGRRAGLGADPGGPPREGLTWARRALRLGTRDPSFLRHAAITAKRARCMKDSLGRVIRTRLGGVEDC